MPVDKDNTAIIAAGWLRIIGLNKHLSVREVISLILDHAEEDSREMLQALIEECPEIVEQFRPRTLSKWFFKIENKPVNIIDPDTGDLITIRFSAFRKYGTEVSWKIVKMPDIFQRISQPVHKILESIDAV